MNDHDHDHDLIIVRLADEELEALTDEDAVPLVPSPWLSRLPPAQREGALAAGLRSLVTRGLVVLPAGPRTGEQVEVGLDADLADVLVVRAEAPLISLWTEEDGSGPSLHAYVSARSVLLEKVTPDGRHGFAVATGDDLPELFAQFGRAHASRADEQGRDTVLLGAQLDRAETRIDMSRTIVDDVVRAFPLPTRSEAGS